MFFDISSRSVDVDYWNLSGILGISALHEMKYCVSSLINSIMFQNRVDNFVARSKHLKANVLSEAKVYRADPSVADVQYVATHRVCSYSKLLARTQVVT